LLKKLRSQECKSVINLKKYSYDKYNRQKNKLARLQKKAVDEGREKKADRLLGRAAKVENRVIKISEKMKSGGSVKAKKKKY
jgi:phage shock protein A